MINSFIISYRETSECSKKNLISLLNYLSWLMNDNSEIILVEQDNNSKINWLSEVKRSEKIKHIFIKNKGNFNKNIGYDIGVKNATGDFIIFNDIDSFLKLDSYRYSINLLNRFDIVNPYKSISFLDKDNSDLFFNSNYNFFISRNNIKITPITEISFSGIMMIKKEKYLLLKSINNILNDIEIKKLSLNTIIVEDVSIHIHSEISDNMKDNITYNTKDNKKDNKEQIDKHDFTLRKLIPKRIFFYWGGSDLSWMRYMTLYSFKKMNPDWDITLYLSDKTIKHKSWKSIENQDYHTYKGKTYFNEIKKLNIKIEKAELPIEISKLFSKISPVHESDLFRYYQLFKNGGFYCDMDVLFFKPIDDFYNDIIDGGYDTIIHEYKSNELTIGFLGSCVNNDYYKNLFEFGINNYKEDDYQSMGIQLIYKMFGNNSILESIAKKYPNLKIYNLPTTLIYNYDWTKINYCFSNSVEIKQFHPNSIGYHWYGGGIQSQKYNNILNEKNYTEHKTTFSKISEEIINMKVDKNNRIIIENDKNIKISIVMASYKRAELLKLGLLSILRQKINYPLEIVVVNDGIEDNTQKVCDSFKKKLNIKYVFSGQRNKNEMIYRSVSIPLNIGVKQSNGNIIILTCPEIFHLNDCLEKIIEPLINNYSYLTIPDTMYFDDTGEYTDNLLKNLKDNSINNINGIFEDSNHILMPFLMGIWKNQILDINGYDEDFIGYAGEDNDFVDRLISNGCEHHKVDASIIHLYHGKRCSGLPDWGNPKWVYNYNLYTSRKGIIIRNENREWGKI